MSNVDRKTSSVPLSTITKQGNLEARLYLCFCLPSKRKHDVYRYNEACIRTHRPTAGFRLQLEQVICFRLPFPLTKLSESGVRASANAHSCSYMSMHADPS